MVYLCSYLRYRVVCFVVGVFDVVAEVERGRSAVVLGAGDSLKFFPSLLCTYTHATTSRNLVGISSIERASNALYATTHKVPVRCDGVNPSTVRTRLHGGDAQHDLLRKHPWSRTDLRIHTHRQSDVWEPSSGIFGKTSSLKPMFWVSWLDSVPVTVSWDPMPWITPTIRCTNICIPVALTGIRRLARCKIT